MKEEIILKNINLIYDSVITLKDINITLDVTKGAIYIIRGESASEKSSLINILGLNESPTSGIIEFPSSWYQDNETIKKQYIGMVHHLNGQNKMKAYEHLIVPLLDDDINSKDGFEKHVFKTFERFGLEDRMDHYLSELTRQEKQKLQLARALIYNPRILLLDQLFGDMDDGVIQIIERLKQRGHTIIIATQTKAYDDLADYVYCLSQGELKKYEW